MLLVGASRIKVGIKRPKKRESDLYSDLKDCLRVDSLSSLPLRNVARLYDPKMDRSVLIRVSAQTSSSLCFDGDHRCDAIFIVHTSPLAVICIRRRRLLNSSINGLWHEDGARGVLNQYTCSLVYTTHLLARLLVPDTQQHYDKCLHTRHTHCAQEPVRTYIVLEGNTQMGPSEG